MRQAPYRSLEFQFETFDRPVFQPAAVVNYPNENAYTRCTEFKSLTGQEHTRTTVVYEYPKATGDRPIRCRDREAAIYRQYQALAERSEGVHFCGRLASYRYYNMDQVVAQALTCRPAFFEGRTALRPKQHEWAQGSAAPTLADRTPFSSFWGAGFESACHINKAGVRLDIVSLDPA